MSKIVILAPHEAHKIAAGEVVERPANVVKELLENSLDAGATTVELWLEDAGRKRIMVVDNGSGMSRDDLERCWLHHATSKITTVDDLTRLTTFGFRGEALSSIASVSNMRIVTKDDASDTAHALTIAHGVHGTVELVSGNRGTTVTIEQLFDNVPARKKFLRSKETEWRAISLLFQALSYEHTHVHFKLYSEGKLSYNCPADQSLAQRMAMYNESSHAQLLDIVSEENGIHVEGVISGHQYARYDRSGIVLLVNHRWVKNSALVRAVVNGYANVLPAGKYPIGCVRIMCDLHDVDVNIHPRKEEVQFAHPRRVEQLITKAVKNALEQEIARRISRPVFLQPATAMGDMRRVPTPARMTALAGATYSVESTLQDTRGRKDAPFQPFDFNAYFQQQTPLTEAPVQLTTGNTSISLEQQESAVLVVPRVIGQCNTTYILAEHGDGLLMIDQHAAHERILYEKYAERFSNASTTHLLFPEIIDITRGDMELFAPHISLIASYGIAIEQCGPAQLIVTAKPVHAQSISIAELVQQVIASLHEVTTITAEQLRDYLDKKVRAQMACKAAVKAGDVLDHEQMVNVIKELYAVENRLTCPHGRPTSWLLSCSEIEKKFKRRL